MSRRSIVLCGVPLEHCSGFRYVTDQALPQKAHTSHGEAFACHRRYLLAQGYEQLDDSRSFRPPNGGPIRILAKKTRFGQRLRLGKEGARFMPEPRDAGNRGVIIVT